MLLLPHIHPGMSLLVSWWPFGNYAKLLLLRKMCAKSCNITLQPASKLQEQPSICCGAKNVTLSPHFPLSGCVTATTSSTFEFFFFFFLCCSIQEGYNGISCISNKTLPNIPRGEAAGDAHAPSEWLSLVGGGYYSWGKGERSSKSRSCSSGCLQRKFG